MINIEKKKNDTRADPWDTSQAAVQKEELTLQCENHCNADFFSLEDARENKS